MKNITLFLIFLLLASQSSAFTDNPTAPYDYFKKFEGDYTDTDGDGMTDVAEKRYGFDPKDAESRPVDNGYFIAEDDHVEIIDSKPTGDANDRMYIRFKRFPEHLENQYKDITVHLIPILVKKLGNPANNQILNIYNRGKVSSAWTVSNQGRTMMVSEWYNPKMFIHELLHAWKGKYTFTNKKGSSDTSWSHTKDTAGFEEGSADGMTIEIIHEFIDCYPSHQMSKFCTSNIQSLRTGTTSTFDFTRGDQFMSCGNLWYDPSSIHHRYAIAGDTFRILTTHDEHFMRKALDKYYAKIDADMTYRPSAENLINVFAEVLPEVNGVKTKNFLENLPWFSGKKIQNRLHIVNLENHQGWGGGAPWIYPAFANTYGKTYQYNAKYSNIDKHGLPTWLKYYEDKWGYLYPDHMDQPFEVKINTIFGEHIDTIEARTHKGNYDSDGKPKNLGKVSVKSLARSNWPVGLYKQTITFTEYAKHTEHASTDSYFFGYENFSQDKQNEFVIMLGVDCEVAEKVLFRLGDYHQTVEIVNGCAIFRTNKIPTNSKFIAEFDVFDINGSKQTYKRAVIKTAYTRDMYLQHSYVVIDRNFNGIEDIYEDGEIVSLKNPNHLKYDDIRRNSHPMFLSFNNNLHNDVTATLQPDGIMLSSKTAKYMYVFDEKDNQLSVTSKSTSEELRRIVEFSRYPKDSLKKLKVRTLKVVNGKNLNSPFRIFSVQDILDGKLIEEKNYEFVDENFVHNANDLNISSVLGGVQLTWKTFENELPTAVIHNGTHKIADRGTNGFFIDYNKFGLNGTEELVVHFEVLDILEKKFLYRTNEFIFKLSDYKSTNDENWRKEFFSFVDTNNNPKILISRSKKYQNGIRFDWNDTSEFRGLLRVTRGGLEGEYLIYGDHSKEFAEINLYNKGVSQRPIAEVALMIYDNLGYGEENYHWESNIISIDLSEYELKPPTDDTDKPPADDYQETIAGLEEQIEQLMADLNAANEEISQKDETIAELQSTNQELANENEDLRGELAEEVEKNDGLTIQVANLTQENNTLSYDLGVKTEQLEQAVEMAQVPFINGWVYDNDRGWMFTDADHYPMIYTHKDDTWHYFELGSNPRFFFNFKSQQWEAWDALPEENDSNLADNNNL